MSRLYLSRIWPLVLAWPSHTNLQPASYLPLSAALAWRQMGADALILAATPDLADGVRLFAADFVGPEALQVEVGQAPAYVGQLASEGNVGNLDESERPADLIAAFSATAGAVQSEPQS